MDERPIDTISKLAEESLQLLSIYFLQTKIERDLQLVQL
jgi:hypothetical protein